MKKESLQEYLGMAIHFIYYHENRLHKRNLFEEDYCKHLKRIGEQPYWQKMYECLTFALSQEDYCLSITNHPFQQRYSDANIRLFFEKFHEYLGECLKTYE